MKSFTCGFAARIATPLPFTRSRILPATQAIRPYGGSVASWSLSSLGLTPSRGHCVVFLDKTLCSHIASLHPGLQICSSANLILGVSMCGPVSHPGQEGENGKGGRRWK